MTVPSSSSLAPSSLPPKRNTLSRPAFENAALLLQIDAKFALELRSWAKSHIPESAFFETELGTKKPEPGTPARYYLEDEPHITLLGGIPWQKDLASRAQDVVRKKGAEPLTVELGTLCLFRSNPSYDVLVVSVRKGDIHQLHEELREGIDNEDAFPLYRPHVTLAFVAKGSCDHMEGNSLWNKTPLRFDRFYASDQSGAKHPVMLSPLSKSASTSPTVGVHTPHHYETVGGKRKRVVGAHPREAGRVSAHSSGGLLVNLHGAKRSGMLSPEQFESHKDALKTQLGGKWAKTDDGRGGTNWNESGWVVPQKHASALQALLPNASWHTTEASSSPSSQTASTKVSPVKAPKTSAKTTSAKTTSAKTTSTKAKTSPTSSAQVAPNPKTEAGPLVLTDADITSHVGHERHYLSGSEARSVMKHAGVEAETDQKMIVRGSKSYHPDAPSGGVNREYFLDSLNSVNQQNHEHAERQRQQKERQDKWGDEGEKDFADVLPVLKKVLDIKGFKEVGAQWHYGENTQITVGGEIPTRALVDKITATLAPRFKRTDIHERNHRESAIESKGWAANVLFETKGKTGRLIRVSISVEDAERTKWLASDAYKVAQQREFASMVGTARADLGKRSTATRSRRKFRKSLLLGGQAHLAKGALKTTGNPDPSRSKASKRGWETRHGRPSAASEHTTLPHPIALPLPGAFGPVPSAPANLKAKSRKAGEAALQEVRPLLDNVQAVPGIDLGKMTVHHSDETDLSAQGTVSSKDDVKKIKAALSRRFILSIVQDHGEEGKWGRQLRFTTQTKAGHRVNLTLRLTEGEPSTSLSKAVPKVPTVNSKPPKPKTVKPKVATPKSPTPKKAVVIAKLSSADPKKSRSAKRGWQTRHGMMSAEEEKKLAHQFVGTLPTPPTPSKKVKATVPSKATAPSKDTSSPEKAPAPKKARSKPKVVSVTEPHKFNLNAAKTTSERPEGVSPKVVAFLRTRVNGEDEKDGAQAQRAKKAPTIHAMVEVPTPHGQQRGIVVSTTKGYSWVLTPLGTFPLPHAHVKSCKRKIVFDWKKMAAIVPREGSVVTVRDTHSGVGEDGKLGMSVKRVLAEPLPSKAGGKVKVLAFRPGRTDAVLEHVERDRIVGPYMPEKFFDEQEKLRTRVRPEKVKAREQLLREATNLSYVKHLPKNTQKKLAQDEQNWFTSNERELHSIAGRVAHRMLLSGDAAQILESDANLGALEALRSWSRDPAEQKARKLRNLAKHDAFEQSLEEGTPDFDKYVALRVQEIAKVMSDEQLRTRYARAAAYREAVRRADELMDSSGFSGINPAQIARVERAERELMATLGKRPDDAQIAYHLGWGGQDGVSKVLLCKARLTARRASRLSELEREDEGGHNIHDKLADSKPYQDEEAKASQDLATRRILALSQHAGLTDREKTILFYGLKFDMLSQPKASGAALEIAKHLRKKFETKDTQGGVLLEWKSVQGKLAAFARSNPDLAHSIVENVGDEEDGES